MPVAGVIENKGESDRTAPETGTKGHRPCKNQPGP